MPGPYKNDPVVSVTDDTNDAAIQGTSSTNTGNGVSGTSIRGGFGVYGESQTNSGVCGIGHQGAGVYGESQTDAGVRGVGHQGPGVSGTSEKWFGTYGESQVAAGVCGIGHQGAGVSGTSETGIGTYGESQQADGVQGVSKADGRAGVAGINDVANGFGVYGRCANGIGIFSTGSRLAGRFEGDVEVTGDIRLINADCAEDFDIADAGLAEPGTVMVLGDEGSLYQSHHPYDKRVAGVISGAGDYKPGLILDKQGSQGNRRPVALLGKVFCKVDAQFGSIEVGDLLTTSPTPGHAMRADDPFKAFGAVIGKALRPLTEGQGLIPILIALQ